MASRTGFISIDRGDPGRHFPVDKHGHSMKSYAAFMKLTFASKMCHLHIMLTLLLCLVSTAHCSVVQVGQAPGNVFQKRGNQDGQYSENLLEIRPNILEGNERKLGRIGNKRTTAQKLREIAKQNGDRITGQDVPRGGAIRAVPVTLTAEINFGLADLENFLRALVFSAAPSVADRPKDSTSRRSTRDTEAQTSSDSTAPWTSNLSPAAVVGTIVGGTVGVFLIVVLTAIFCSYRNYESLEVRRRTAEVFGHHGNNAVHPV